MSESPQIKALKERYKKSLREKSEIASNWSNVFKQGNTSENSVAELSGWLHQLAGSAGMYEFDQIAQLCRDAMILLRETNVSALTVSETLDHISETMAAAAQLP